MFSFIEAFQHNANQALEWARDHGQVWAYAFGLLTVGCLALRRKTRGIAISGFLTLLWLWMGMGFLRETPAWSHPKTWLGLAILLQGGLFLWFGVIRSRLSFEPRASVRPIAGAVILIFALAIFPLLRQALQLSWGSWAALPFPGLLLTFGLLLFLKRPVPVRVLAIPLAWAALGGDRIFEAMSWADGVHLAAFVAGLSLLIAPREELRDGDGNYRSEALYELAYRSHERWGRFLWSLLLTAGLFLSLSFFVNPPLLGSPLDHLAASSLATLVVGLTFWLALPAWHSVGFRYLAWGAVRAIHGAARAGNWVAATWGRVLIVLLVAIFAGWQLGLREVVLRRWEDNTIQAFSLGIIVLVVLRAVYVARRRIVISPFVDCTTNGDEAERRGKALANRLRNELVNISELYRTIDEAHPGQKDKIERSAVAVEDVVESALDAVGPESMKVRNVEIPIGLLIRAIGRLVHGPRLTGSFQPDGEGRYLLLAELSGGRWRTRSWKISSDDLEEKDRSKEKAEISQRMIEHLACRIIPWIGDVGSPRWEAVYHYTKALRAYRRTQLAAKDSRPELRRAEREFIKALQEDATFTQCHYNLGVIYKELQQPSSAEASFRCCLAEDPGRAEAYYSLADVYFDEGDYRRASIYAGKALESRPSEARTWNLRGVAQEMLYTESERSKELQEERKRRGRKPEEILTDIEIAVAVAWRALCRAALTKPAESPRKEMQLAGLTLANLAVIRMEVREPGSLEASLRNIRQALHLHPQDPWYHLILGEVLAHMRCWEEAKTELYRAFGDNLEPENNADRWAFLLATASRLLAKSKNPKDRKQLKVEVERAFRNFLDAAVPPEALILAGGERQGRTLLAGYGGILESCERNLASVEDLMAEEGAGRLTALNDCLLLLRRLYLKPEKKVAIAKPATDEEREWRGAQIRIHRAWTILQTSPSHAIRLLEKAIEILDRLDAEKEWPTRQKEREGLHSLLARAYLLSAKSAGPKDAASLQMALCHAELSVGQRPESALRRWILADAYSDLHDLDQAATERETAFNLEFSLEVLGTVEEICEVAEAYDRRTRVANSKLRNEYNRRAQKFFRDLLERIESDSLGPDPVLWEERLHVHACVHYWMGIFHYRLEEKDEAIYHLEIARAMGYKPIVVARRLKKIYGEAGFPVETAEELHPAG